VNWARNFGTIDPEHRKEWTTLMSSEGTGMILKSMTTDYKFVRNTSLFSLDVYRRDTFDRGYSISVGARLESGSAVEVFIIWWSEDHSRF
jgi:hypothetical protein